MKIHILDIIYDEKEWLFVTGLWFRGLTVSVSPEGWNIILRATTRAGEPVYAMTQNEDITQGLRDLVAAVSAQGGQAVWRHDRYAK